MHQPLFIELIIIHMIGPGALGVDVRSAVATRKTRLGAESGFDLACLIGMVI